MGKQNFNNNNNGYYSNKPTSNSSNLRGRLSSLDRSHGLVGKTNYDARFKLNKRGGEKFTRALTHDARDLLDSRRTHRPAAVTSKNDNYKSTSSSRMRASTDPIVIVTGLNNVRKDSSNRLHVVNRPPPGKCVISDGVNTIVTLRNTNAVVESEKMKYTEDSTSQIVDELDEDESLVSGVNEHVARKNGKFDNHDKEFKAIKVMFDNDRASTAAAAAAAALPSSKSMIPAYSSSSRRPTSPSPSHFRRDEEVEINHQQRYQQRRSPSPSNRISHHQQQRYSSPPRSRYERSDIDHHHHHQHSSRSSQVAEPMDYEDQPTSTSSNGDSYYNIGSSSSSNGYKLVISNLHSRVTEDDILELFSDIGPIKRARFLDKGVAEVVYVKLDHAKEAIYKYDRSELDGRQMRIELLGPSSAASSSGSNHQISSSSSSSLKKQQENGSSKSSSNHHRSSHTISTTNSNSNSHQNRRSTDDSRTTSSVASTTVPVNSISNKFKLLQRNETSSIQLPESSKNSSTPKIHVDSSVIHSVLFNKPTGSSKNGRDDNPVTFTVKL